MMCFYKQGSAVLAQVLPVLIGGSCVVLCLLLLVSGWTLQFAAPDVAHATGVTIGFVAGGIEATMKMNRSFLSAPTI